MTDDRTEPMSKLERLVDEIVAILDGDDRGSIRLTDKQRAMLRLLLDEEEARRG